MADFEQRQLVVDNADPGISLTAEDQAGGKVSPLSRFFSLFHLHLSLSLSLISISISRSLSLLLFHISLPRFRLVVRSVGLS